MRAFVSPWQFEDMLAGQSADTFIIPIKVTFCGQDVPRIGGIDKDEIVVTLLFTDTLAQMADKVEDAIVARAAALGVAGFPKTSILMPTMSKGTT